VSTKGSCADPKAKGLPIEPSDVVVDLMGLYVVHDQSTMLVALGIVYDNSSTIHNVPYADDVLRVNVVTVYHREALVPYPTLEVRFVSQAVGTFVAWPTHLVKKVSDEVISFSYQSILFFVIINYMYTNCYYH